MVSRPSLLRAYLALHGYNDQIGEYEQAFNGTFQFHVKHISNTRFQGQISEMAPAPSRSFLGTKNEGAVPWLYITSMPDPRPGRSIGIATVYRYYTAGGKPPSPCGVIGQTLQVPYAAQYWIYERSKRKQGLAIEYYE
jgi:hypothetical protein